MKAILTTIVALLFSGMVWGQETLPNETISIKNNLPTNVKAKYKKGSLVNFKIENVNFLKVKGSRLESSGTNFTFDTPSLSTDLVAALEKSKVAQNQTSVDSSAIFNPIPEEIPEEKEFSKLYLSFLSQSQSIERAIALESTLKNLIGDDVFVGNTNDIIVASKKLHTSIYNNDEDIFQKINELKTTYATLKISYEEINKNNPKNEITVSGELKSKDNKETFKISDAKITSTAKNKFADEFESAKKAIAVFDDEKKKNEIIQKAEAGTTLYNRIKTENFIHYTVAVQLNDDFVTLKPSIVGLDDKVLKEYNLTLKTYSRTRVNFSTGYFLSFIGNEEYDYRFNDTGAIEGVNKVTSDDITHAIGFLAHVLFEGESNKFPQWGLSSGISLNTDAKINFYGGVSMAFTEKNRLVFTAGLSFVNVKRLNRHNLDANNNFSSSAHQEIKYVERYKAAPFFSVTYNLSNN